MGKSIYDISPDVKNTLGYYRFNEHNTTCPENLYDNFIDGIFKRSEDSFFFINMVQFVIVTFMYYAFGKGRYWNVLFYAAVSGGIASLLENITLAYICREEDFNKKRVWLLPFFIAEFFWIIEEYSIPILNLIKMKSFSSGTFSKMVNTIVTVNFTLFSICRFYIGYSRMKYGILHSANIGISHALAFTVMAISDLICTISILYHFKKHKKKYNIDTSISNYIKNSSYKVLIWVDFVSVFLAIFQALTQFESLGIPHSLVNPFQCVKCGFILILATDSLLFKYRANNNPIENSYNIQHKKTRFNIQNDFDDTFKRFTKTKSTYSVSNLGSYDYPMDDLNNPDNNYEPYQSKNVVKSSHSQQSPILFNSIYNRDDDSDDSNDEIYTSQTYHNNNNSFYQNSQSSIDCLLPKSNIKH